MQQKLSRRSFLRNTSKVAVGTIGILTLGRYFTFSQINTIPEIKAETSPKQQNEKRILIAYDTKFGSTAEIAEFIGKNIPPGNRAVDVKRIENVNDLKTYEQVIIGSAIQYDKYLHETRDFIVKHENELAKKNASFFLVCLVLSKKTEKAKLQADNYAAEIENLIPNVKVNNFGKFAGVLDYRKMSFLQRIGAKGIFLILGIKEGDYRDWKAIENWTKNLSLN